MTSLLTYEGFPPPVPYIGVLLDDMMKLEELRNRDENQLINWNKMRKMATNFHFIRTIQAKRTEIIMKPTLQLFVDFCQSEAFHPLNEKEQMSLSKLCEPPKSKKSGHTM